MCPSRPFAIRSLASKKYKNDGPLPILTANKGLKDAHGHPLLQITNKSTQCRARRLKKSKLIKLPFIPDYVDRHSWYMYAPCFVETVNRNEVVKSLDKAGIETRLSFPPVHTQPYYKNKFSYSQSSFPISYKAWSHLINIPISPNLSIEDIDYISEKLILATNKYCSV